MEHLKRRVAYYWHKQVAGEPVMTLYLRVWLPVDRASFITLLERPFVFKHAQPRWLTERELRGGERMDI